MNNVFTWTLSRIGDWLAQNWDATLGILLGGIISYYLGSIVVSYIVRRVVKTTQRDMQKRDVEKRQKTLAQLFVNIWRILIIFISCVSLVKLILPSFDLTALFASAGIIGVALGFGAQSLVKDFLSGIFIVTENQYRVGDVIDIEGFSGTVERISTRSTVVRDVDGNVHYFPNGMIMHVINKTMGYSMARFIIGIHPSSDIEKVTNIINEVGSELSQEEKWRKKIIEPPAFVSVGEFSATSLEVIIAGKTQPSDQWAVTAEMRQRLLEAFEKSKIELAISPTQIAAAAPTKKKK